MAPRFCVQCGGTVGESDLHCSTCGAVLPAEQHAPSPPATPDAAPGPKVRSRRNRRIRATLTAATLLALVVVASTWLVPRAQAFDTAVRFLQTVAATDADAARDMLTDSARESARSGEFDVQVAAANHLLAITDRSIADLDGASLALHSDGRFAMRTRNGDVTYDNILTLDMSGDTADVHLEIAGRGSAPSADIIIGLERRLLGWKVTGMTIEDIGIIGETGGR